MFQRFRPSSQSLMSASRSTSFMALRIGDVSFMTPPLPSGISISKVESAQRWSWYCVVSSGRPLMPLAKVVAAFEETSDPKRSSDELHQKLDSAATAADPLRL